MRRAAWFAAGVFALAACGGGEAARQRGIRQATHSYNFEITPDPSPPYANEDIHYTIRVTDRKTNQPVQGGEGQIYGQLTPGGRPYTYDGVVYGPEVGIYHAKLRFVIGAITTDPDAAWQMGLRFRRDSLSPLEVTNWQQQVRPERDSVPVIKR